MFSSASKTARSGTPDYPTPRVLVERMVAELVSPRRWSWVTFETKPMKHFVEVALEGEDELVINVAYRFSEDYQSLFARQSITIPDDWRMSQFKKKGWLGAGTMLLTTGIRDVDRIAEFVVHLFPALYDEPQDFQLSCYGLQCRRRKCRYWAEVVSSIKEKLRCQRGGSAVSAVLPLSLDPSELSLAAKVPSKKAGPTVLIAAATPPMSQAPLRFVRDCEALNQQLFPSNSSAANAASVSAS
ncbi:MAG: hypothetical protein RI897_4050 [Verrucomicrobiota bacterium]|jgi:hypothetical protein